MSVLIDSFIRKQNQSTIIWSVENKGQEVIKLRIWGTIKVSKMKQICNGRANSIKHHQPIDWDSVRRLRRKFILIIYVSGYCQYIYFYCKLFLHISPL